MCMTPTNTNEVIEMSNKNTGRLGIRPRATFAWAALALACGLMVGSAQAAGSSGTEDIRALQSRAESGDVEAQYRLGAAYLDGCGVPADEQEAEKWLTRASRAGNTSAYIRLLPIIKERQTQN